MSTDRKRLSSAIQRIAREDPDIRDIIADYKNRGGIGSTSATVAGADDGRQICCDGSSSDSNNPGSEARDPSDGGQDGLNSDDPANLDDMGPGSLSGVTDCTTGEPICFEGSDWVPPEGWDSPTDPPIDQDYEEGYFWELTSSQRDVTPDPLIQLRISQFNESNDPGCSSWYIDSIVKDDDKVTAYLRRDSSGDCGMGAGVATVDRNACGSSTASYCNPETPPLEDSWPSDDCINLAVKGGKFVASKYDPDVSSGNGWLKGKEEVELCDEFGNSFTVRASGSQPGGWKTISAQNPGDGYLYDATGAQVARISGSEYSDPSI